MIVTAIIFIVILLVLVLSHEAGHFFSARFFGIKVEEFGFGLPPRAVGIKRKGTIYSLNYLPFGGFVKIKGEEGGGADDPESFGSKPAWKRSSILLAGVGANIFLAFLIFSFVSWWGVPRAVEESPNASSNNQIIITEIVSGSPAEKAGILPGDRVLKIDNFAPQSVKELQEFIVANKTNTLKILLERNEKTKEIMIKPRQNPPEGEGPLGVALAQIRIERSPWYWAPVEGAKLTWEVSKLTVFGLTDTVKKLLVKSDEGGEIAVAGPVGIFNLTGLAKESGLGNLLFFVALLSINLALINVLPLPGLDGGRFLFIIIEVVRGRRISERASSIAHGIGLALLLLLMVLITSYDIARVF